MCELNYIIEMLELKDNNIKFYENYYHKEFEFEAEINIF